MGFPSESCIKKRPRTLYGKEKNQWEKGECSFAIESGFLSIHMQSTPCSADKEQFVRA